MSGVSHDEDAEIHVGLVVRPLRGHWRPAKLTKQQRLDTTDSEASHTLDPSVWKTAPQAYDEANMQFISKMVYSSNNVTETDSSTPRRSTRELNTMRRRGEVPINVDALVEPCPNTCSCCTASLGNKFDSPPLKRMELPPDLASVEKLESDVKRVGAEQEVMKSARNAELPSRKMEPNQMPSKPEEKSKSVLDSSRSSVSTSSVSTRSVLSPAPFKRQSSREEARITLKPVTGLPIPKNEANTSGPPLPNFSNRPGIASKERLMPSSKEDVKLKSFLPGSANDRGSKENERLKVKFDVQDGYKGSYLSAPCFSGDLGLTLTDTRKARTAPKTRENVSSEDKKKPKRSSTAMSKSRLKTVTYKEEPFMSEFKSWLLLLVFICVVLFYRSTLSTS